MPKSEMFNREEVIEKALYAFWEKGYKGTSVDTLKEATGLSKSSIYNSFKGGKFTLFLEALKLYRRQQQGFSNKQILKATSPLNAINQFFEAIVVEIVQDKRNLGCFICNCTTELSNENKEVHEFLSSNQDDITQMFQDLIVQAQEEKLIAQNKNPRELALFLISILQGIRVTGMLNQNKNELKAIVNHAISSLG